MNGAGNMECLYNARYTTVVHGLWNRCRPDINSDFISPGVVLMTECNLPIAARSPKSLRAPGAQPELLAWIQQFNWLNYIGLAMFLAPVLFGYGAVHYWLLQHDALLYYGSLYAQLGLLMMAWRQV